MKKFALLLLAVLLIYPIITLALETRQDTDESETLFGNGEITHGGYGAPELKLTQIQGELGLMAGGRGGWIINSSFSIGGGGYGLVTTHKINNYQPPFDSTAYLRVGWGGVFIEYINSSNKLVHFTVNTLIGAGGASYTKSFHDGMNWDNDGWVYESTPFFVVEPGATVDLNVAKFFRISLGASYRFVSGVDLSKTTNKDISGPSANLAFKFGKF
ncbi:MAG: hypothetical protein A2X61_04265 [Ignavibacteria bacterium GWB2_35_12]|nr:MAG: hypothetical protein A2X63_08745 [Ignavibacteria bacterium GWA2_35_8]OGU38895.1 MAG: hypothetical protein A2X61_04265 [Ignavibacteria bacterium GWB2_35_12]OGU85921.1 MAG: hypothetical protein A2220_04970 [Ignavibacteria bacterium RIFOXYA2_FULL_35_10]OGV20349.1 MAG: hypothetical protein A2475_12040 [Ignavibacteria bacterium RIFOXYC2_FULL_35_21]